MDANQSYHLCHFFPSTTAGAHAFTLLSPNPLKSKSNKHVQATNFLSSSTTINPNHRQPPLPPSVLLLSGIPTTFSVCSLQHQAQKKEETVVAKQAMSSAHSTITQVYSTRKRKWDTDSDYSCESTRHTLALSFKMKIEDHREVFKQLYFARYGEAPYDKFGDWKDQNLWVKLFEVLKEQLSFEYGQNTLISLIVDFAKKYADDPKMNWIKDQSLRNHVHAVFSSEPLKDSKGRLSMEAIEGWNSTNIHNPEGVGESSCSHGGRNFFKRSRGAGSSSGGARFKCSEKMEDIAGNRSALSAKLGLYLREKYLSLEQVTAAINHFCDEGKHNHETKILTWLEFETENQLKYIRNLKPALQ